MDRAWWVIGAWSDDMRLEGLEWPVNVRYVNNYHIVMRYDIIRAQRWKAPAQTELTLFCSQIQKRLMSSVPGRELKKTFDGVWGWRKCLKSASIMWGRELCLGYAVLHSDGPNCTSSDRIIVNLMKFPGLLTGLISRNFCQRWDPVLYRDDFSNHFTSCHYLTRYRIGISCVIL